MRFAYTSLLALGCLLGSSLALAEVSPAQDTVETFPKPPVMAKTTTTLFGKKSGTVHLYSITKGVTFTNSSIPNNFQTFLAPWWKAKNNAVNFILDKKNSPDPTQETGVYVVMPESEASCLTRKPANAARGLWIGNVPCVSDPAWNPPNQQWYIRSRRIGLLKGWTFASAMLDGNTCIAPASPYNATYSFTEVKCSHLSAFWMEY
ncbi:hypothetical protein BJ684DRAFT_21751 [Piptocephalis cylindrospora]|uniref:Ricin B lectin domain-containing protein n=1 Tax=Piptocephalis cylindrospora TaxID=1907219 RepID=A0A4V1IXN4_9FUNG|nr:hypothetical protein BJ684DRAFT_21751 [Piptocephalis cylindrospora]|eukprot:RKP11669.1 hypothetical protein BJ684DRAFT_21751 [Piptocephalis cylindrospora]